MPELNHEKNMRAALRLANRAAANGDVPIGCVIVYLGSQADNPENRRGSYEKAIAKHRRLLTYGEIIGRGYNRRNADASALAHAEIIAIRKASRVIGDWRLEHCALYVTLEPCQMCAGAIVQARIPLVVYGSPNPKAGCAGSLMNILENPSFNHQVKVVRGVLEKDCEETLKGFFRDLRNGAKD